VPSLAARSCILRRWTWKLDDQRTTGRFEERSWVGEEIGSGSPVDHEIIIVVVVFMLGGVSAGELSISLPTFAVYTPDGVDGRSSWSSSNDGE
jgi:hypothetical protein